MTNIDRRWLKARLDRDALRNSVANITLIGIVFLSEIDRIAAAKV